MFHRRLVSKTVLRSPVANRFSTWLADRRYRRWQRAHPGQPFSDYYVDHVRGTIDEGKSHPTLGKIGFYGDVGTDVAWDRQSFASRGRGNWAIYRNAGLTHDMKLVDFGCGSLRLGQHAIAFLEANRYWGLDVAPTFIDQGLDLIDPALVADKRPRLSVIDDKTIEDVRAWRPDFILSNAVLQHVPPAELATYFGRIARMMPRGGRAVIMFIPRPSLRRIKAMSWGYDDKTLCDAVRSVDPSLTIRFDTVVETAPHMIARPRRLLLLDRPD